MSAGCPAQPPAAADDRRRGCYLGVDLAWGYRARTGLAVLDRDGRLLASASVRSDEEISDWVEDQVGPSVTAAVDAPLIVPNETGRRRCEAELGEVFARHHAGAHPANRANPLFRPEPRAARLAGRFGWSMDPAVRPGPYVRTCIEVYPHPAMVALFGLDRVLPYKRKQGRDLSSLLAAYGRLLEHLERVCGPVLQLSGSARWQELRTAVAGAVRKADLAAVEDELDAIFCAYLAYRWARDPAGFVVMGDYATGYIVTPRLPPIGDGMKALLPIT